MRRTLYFCVSRRAMFLYNKLGGSLSVALVTVFVVGFMFIRLQLHIEQLESELEGYRGGRSLSWSGDNAATGGNDDELVVIYNRVPKTGSTSFVGIAYELYAKNNFHVLHFNISKNKHVMTVLDQMRFARNISLWSAMKPALYHGHLAYIDFASLGVPARPLYINIVRDPLDRLISYYYFLRNGDDFRPHLKRRRAGNRQSFDECVANDGLDCNPKDLWLQIPFFCGQHAECWKVGSEWALEMAKFNLAHNYLVVGTTEELEEFVAVLEAGLPRFFNGAMDFFLTANRSHLRKTFNKQPASAETIQFFHESPVWKMENEFYEFARDQFQFVKEHILSYHGDRIVGIRHQQFHYEKIRPR